NERALELKEIQDEDTSPSENTSKIPMQVEGFEPPQKEVVLVRRSARTHRALDRLCVNVEVEEYSLEDLNEPPNYKAALLDPKFDKRVDAINVEMQYMKDNQVWCLVDLPLNCKTVGSKWMDTSKRGYIPMQERHDLNKTQGASTPEEVKRMQNVPYASVVGSIMTAVKTILKYLRNTKDMFLVYGENPEAELRVDCYCDVRFETNRNDIKYHTGYVFNLNGGALDWKSSKQSNTAVSTIEAKYIAASEAAMEAVWIRKFISRLGMQLGLQVRQFHLLLEIRKLID
nr:retrotransposon protein, putative, Ty1-copia subclass [Tanacetum cinerariifolium]